MDEEQIKIDIPGLIVIGISGKAGSGKDTVSELIGRAYENAYRLAFADPLKEACADLFGFNVEDYYERETKETVIDFWGVSPRQIAQFVGTEVVRENFSRLVGDKLGNDFWIKRLVGIMQGKIWVHGNYGPTTPFESGDIVLIPDVRFENEYKFILNNEGYIIHLTRATVPDTVGIPNHASEAFVDFSLLPNRHRIMHISNNSTLEDLNEDVLKVTKNIIDNVNFSQSV